MTDDRKMERIQDEVPSPIDQELSPELEEVVQKIIGLISELEWEYPHSPQEEYWQARLQKIGAELYMQGGWELLRRVASRAEDLGVNLDALEYYWDCKCGWLS